MLSSFAFASPALLGALVVLPAIWWLLKLTPPRPQAEVFPPLKILATVLKREETPARSPWWLTLLRMIMATLVILALADPVLNPRSGTVAGGGPLVLMIDNGWASAPDWERRVETADGLIDEAENKGVAISMVFSAEPTQDAVPTDPATAREKLRAAKPHPLVPDRAKALASLQTALKDSHPGTLAFLTDGLAAKDNEQLGAALSALKPDEVRVIADDGKATLAITSAANGAERLNAKVTRLATAEPQQVIVDAQDQQGRPIATGTARFASGESVATAEIAAPYELRNDFARLSIAGLASAGSVHLLDDGFRRRKVALLSGDANDEFQPLLSPLYYIERALQPYADLIKAQDKDLATAIPKLLQQNPSVVVMADIGRMPPDVQQQLLRFVKRGGTLIRFAGPRLAAAPVDDPLVPVMLRQGERQLGGALSWAVLQALAPFPDAGPFAGLPAPDGIVVKRQVLAEPTPDLADRTWASLTDGTPLVTSKDIGAGRIVLFHVSAEASWSNLPISGAFVEMLRRIVQLSHAGSVTASTTGAAAALPPYRLLTERGALTAEAGNAKPLELGAKRPLAASFDNPPGLYGSEDGFAALNLLPHGAELKPVDLSGASVAMVREALIGATAKPLKPFLLGLALALFILDSLVVLIMGGAFARLPKRGAIAVFLAIAALGLCMLPMDRAQADDTKPGDELLLQRLDNTHLAYVKTGESDVDTLSERGLSGLTEYMSYRTTLEPGAPVGLDITKDELSLYPIIFWPISATAPMPSAEAISRIDAYMRAGGTVLFDTRDQFSSFGGDGAPSANGERLRAILANIDIPPLEPVPKDHVLTRSFYLLHTYPGRYNGSPLWVEARQEAKSKGKELTSGGDGVSPIIITGNDFLGAWAIDANGVPLLPTVPADERQREISYRVGVNIMMYMLTGNYKADQVHVPALLERLGQ
ncbi:DUF4159 domain-containing protein [Rhizobium sp.]|jgi:hypothetical protein|uniref:DUF4159 domain-containing protein n=1 Tax=Rhizobium sp. TaxID=391 RepID=UPI000E957A87|nr:RNA-binding protein [Rhizobium sp.]